MTYKRHLVAIIMFCSYTQGIASVGESLENKYKRAKTNTQTLEGALFDRKLGLYFNDQPDLASEMTKCLKGTQSSKSVYGVFEFFEKKGTYQLLLQPNNDFSTCLSAVFEGRNPPSPPKLPYLNPFKFSLKK